MVPQGLQDFAGVWRIERRIEDLGGGPAGRFEGEAVLTPTAGGLAYEESGLLRLGAGVPMLATRRYLWQAAGPGRIEVAFEDGRPFHGFELDDGAEAAHDCAPDLYRVRYRFGDWPRWEAVWRVTGPRKDYRMESRYARPG